MTKVVTKSYGVGDYWKQRIKRKTQEVESAQQKEYNESTVNTTTTLSTSTSTLTDTVADLDARLSALELP